MRNVNLIYLKKRQLQQKNIFQFILFRCLTATLLRMIKDDNNDDDEDDDCDYDENDDNDNND